MIIAKAPKDLFSLLQEFLIPYEHTCVQLASYVRKQSEHIFFIFDDNNQQNISKQPFTAIKSLNILGILYLDRTVFHCLPKTSLQKIISSANYLNQLKTFILEQTEKTKIKSISGEAESTQFLINLLQESLSTPYQINHYKLLTASSIHNPPDQLYNDDEIKRCTEDDLEILLPLQKQYLTEEVAPHGKTVSDAETAIGLRQVLKNQLCLTLFSNDEPVAKANTNAIGINWIQIGGVYTHPLYRRNGYAWQLISAICRRTSKAGKKAALFVKDNNFPAIELYNRLGFGEAGKYTIVYY